MNAGDSLLRLTCPVARSALGPKLIPRFITDCNSQVYTRPGYCSYTILHYPTVAVVFGAGS